LPSLSTFSPSLGLADYLICIIKLSDYWSLDDERLVRSRARKDFNSKRHWRSRPFGWEVMRLTSNDPLVAILLFQLLAAD